MAEEERADEERPDEAAAAGEAAPTPEQEEELRRRIEEGLRQVRVQDVLLESVVTLVNLTARRIGKEDERDLEQARVGIEAVNALVDLLEPEAQTQVRNALSELQMLYARAAGGAGPGPAAASSGGAEATPEEGAAPRQGEPGDPGAGGRGGGPPPGLWVPPGSA
jgi:hypothetical protein